MAEDSLIRVVLGQEPLVAGQGKPDAIQIARAKEAKVMASILRKNEANNTSGWDKSKKWMSKTLGINITTSAILKQSQIFTSFMGTIFQLFGALVDVILAPFLPILIPVIRILGGLIPIIHKIMQDVVAPRILALAQGAESVGRWLVDFWKAPSWGKLWAAMPSIGSAITSIPGLGGFLRALTPVLAGNLGTVFASLQKAVWWTVNPFNWVRIGGSLFRAMANLTLPGRFLVSFFDEMVHRLRGIIAPIVNKFTKIPGMQALAQRMAGKSAEYLIRQANIKAFHPGDIPGSPAQMEKFSRESAKIFGKSGNRWISQMFPDVINAALRPVQGAIPASGGTVAPTANWFARNVINKITSESFRASFSTIAKSPMGKMLLGSAGSSARGGLSGVFSFKDALEESEHGLPVQLLHAAKGVGMIIASVAIARFIPSTKGKLAAYAAQGLLDVYLTKQMMDLSDAAAASGTTNIWNSPLTGLKDLNWLVTFKTDDGSIVDQQHIVENGVQKNTFLDTMVDMTRWLPF